jgi:M-phase inducer tyrosine phosphatase
MSNDHAARKPFANISNVVPSMKRKFSTSFTRAVSHSNIFRLINGDSTKALSPQSSSEKSVAQQKLLFHENLNSHTETPTSSDSDFEDDTIIDPQPYDAAYFSKSIAQPSATSNLLDNAVGDDDIPTDDDVDEEEESNQLPDSPTQRPRRIRRFHSTVQTAKEKQDCQFEDNSNLKKSSISTFNVSSDLLPRVNETELAKIITEDTFFDEVIIIDCRFSYEFNGGHIKDAINLFDKQELTKFFHSKQPINANHKQLIVFHCEFSIFRGPTMAQHLRSFDRQHNSDSYPFLSYPDIVVLDGGYSRFYKKFCDLCTGGYVEMRDESHERNCDLEMHRVRRDAKLNRAKSYNQFSPIINSKAIYSDHNRSRSYTTISGEKFAKRQKSNSQFISSPIQQKPLSRSSSTFSNVESIFNSPVKSNIFDSQLSEIDFQPPTAFFKHGHKKSSSSSFSLSGVSINSSLSSISSDNEFSNSTDLIADTYSPTSEDNGYFEPASKTINTSTVESAFDSHPNKLSGLLSFENPASGKDCSEQTQFTQANISPAIHSCSQYSYNKLKSRPALKKINTFAKYNSPSLLISSPISSPHLLFDRQVSPVPTSSPSILDPINDQPIDFGLPSSLYNNKGNTSSNCTSSRRRFGNIAPTMNGTSSISGLLDVEEDCETTITSTETPTE